MLKNKRILLTGANGGIGISTANILLENNAQLVLLYHKNKEQIDKILNRYPNFKSMVECYEVDLLNDESIDKNLERILKKGGIDIYIHSISTSFEPKSIIKANWNDFLSNIEIQTKSFFKITQKIIPHMKEKSSGKIIALLSSSIIGKPPNLFGPYIVGKYSLLGLAKCLAVELGNLGITVNCVSPSMTNTPLIEKLPLKLKEITVQQTPLGRIANPDDVASTILFLCSKYSDYISGENLIVSGGQTMH